MIVLATTLSVLVLSSALAGSKLAKRKSVNETSSKCPEKWLDASFMEMGCLLFNNTAAVTWEEAKAICKEDSNATLVDIQSEMQLDFLGMELDVIANTEGTSHYWWTAGTDAGREGQWYWATTLTEVGDFVWAPYEPNQTGNCLYLVSNWGYKGGDRSCETTRGIYPICQLKWFYQ